MTNRPNNFDLSALRPPKPKQQSQPDPRLRSEPKQEREETAAKPQRVARPSETKSKKPSQPSGFKTRRSAAPLRRQRLAGRPRGEERHQFNVRMLPEDAASFIQMAETEGVTYGDLVAKMLKRIDEVGLKDDGAE